MQRITKKIRHDRVVSGSRGERHTCEACVSKIGGKTVKRKDLIGRHTDDVLQLEKASTCVATKTKEGSVKARTMPKTPKNIRVPANAVNVCALKTKDNVSAQELLAWVNEILQGDFKEVEELCTGAVYCNFMDMLLPDSVQMKNVKFRTNIIHEYKQNFEILQAAFKNAGVNKIIPIHKLISGQFKDNLKFLNWFKKFFEAKYDGRPYNAIAARNNAPLGMGKMIMKTSGRSTVRKRVPVTFTRPPRPNLPLCTPKKSTHSIKKICQLSESKTELKQQFDELYLKYKEMFNSLVNSEREKNFCIKKLREIEVFCQENNNDSNLGTQRIIQKTFEILYKSDDDVGSSEVIEEQKEN